MSILQRYKRVSELQVPDLLDLKRDAILVYREHGDLEHEAYLNFLQSEGDRKIETANIVQKCRLDGLPVSSGENEARIQLKTLYEKEYEYDAAYRKFRSYRETLMEIIHDLSQRISISKQTI